MSSILALARRAGYHIRTNQLRLGHHVDSAWNIPWDDERNVLCPPIITSIAFVIVHLSRVRVIWWTLCVLVSKDKHEWGLREFWSLEEQRAWCERRLGESLTWVNYYILEFIRRRIAMGFAGKWEIKTKTDDIQSAIEALARAMTVWPCDL